MKIKKGLNSLFNIKLLGLFLLLVGSFFLLLLSINFKTISIDNKLAWWFIKISQFIYIVVVIWSLINLIKFLFLPQDTSFKDVKEYEEIINKVIPKNNEGIITNSIIRNTILNIEDKINNNRENNTLLEINSSHVNEFYEYIALPLVTTNKSGIIVGCNQLAQEFFTTELVGKNISNYISPLEVNTLNYCNIVKVKLLHLFNTTTSVFQTSIFKNKEIESVILLFLPYEVTLIKDSSQVKKNNKSSFSNNGQVNKLTSPPDRETFNSEDAIKDFINNFPIAIVILNSLGKVTYFNNTFNNLINILHKYKNNNPFTDNNLISCNMGDDFKSIFNNILSCEQLNNIANGNGKKFQIKIQNCYLDIFYKHKNNNIFITLENVSEKRKLELQNTFSQRLQTIGQIASAVAHDFNNLLTAIMSFTYFLKERYSEDDPSTLELEQIEQNSNRAKVMIRQLLTFSRGKELNPVSFLVNSEISNLMSTILRLMGERIKTEFIRGRNIGKITMDPVQFQQIIINLVVNARDAMKNNGKLVISTKVETLKQPEETVLTTIPAGEYIVISIQDQGEGIKKENFKKIFQTHFSTKGDKGNGLGLATVAKIMQENSGFIALESTLNQGTTFHLYFSTEKPSVPKDSMFNNQDLPLTTSQIVDNNKDITLDLTGTGTILLVEDEIPVRTVCKRALINKGYQVIEAEDAETALTLLQNIPNKVDLIISDVMMPGISGLEFISEAKKINPDLKAILMSGYAEEALEDNHYTLDSIEFLAKPFNPDVLATKVKKVISS